MFSYLVEKIVKGLLLHLEMFSLSKELEESFNHSCDFLLSFPLTPWIKIYEAGRVGLSVLFGSIPEVLHMSFGLGSEHSKTPVQTFAS